MKQLFKALVLALTLALVGGAALADDGKVKDAKTVTVGDKDIPLGKDVKMVQVKKMDAQPGTPVEVKVGKEGDKDVITEIKLKKK